VGSSLLGEALKPVLRQLSSSVAQLIWWVSKAVCGTLLRWFADYALLAIRHLEKCSGF